MPQIPTRKLPNPEQLVKDALNGCKLEESSGDERIAEALNKLAREAHIAYSIVNDYEKEQAKASKRIYIVISIGYDKGDLVNDFDLVRGDALEEFLACSHYGIVTTTSLKWGCQKFFTVWDDGLGDDTQNPDGHLDTFDKEEDFTKDYNTENCQILVWLKRGTDGYSAFKYDGWVKFGRPNCTKMLKIFEEAVKEI
jgi:hypothetical protein